MTKKVSTGPFHVQISLKYLFKMEKKKTDKHEEQNTIIISKKGVRKK